MGKFPSSFSLTGKHLYNGQSYPKYASFLEHNTAFCSRIYPYLFYGVWQP